MQVWNYGDEPEPRLPKFAFVDPDGKAGDKYDVVAVNHATSNRSRAKPRPQSRPTPKKVLLIASGPDGHPATTHEYVAGLDILAKLLKPVAGVEVTVAKADGAWKDGPELIGRSDVVVLYLPKGRSGFPRTRSGSLRSAHAKCGGGLVVLHWGMGTKDAEPIAAFVELFGGCHGGPDASIRLWKQPSQSRTQNTPSRPASRISR